MNFSRILAWIDCLVAPLPGLMLIVAGMSMTAAAILMTDWQANHKMAWNLQLMRAQADVMKDQEGRYQKFYEAVKADDPIVIERLAYYQFRLKPAGSTPIHDVTQSPIAGPLLRTVSFRSPESGKTYRPVVVNATIDQVLQKPIPQPGINYPVYRPVESGLVMLTTGPIRFVVLAAGILCLIAGVFSPSSAKEASNRSQTPGSQEGGESRIEPTPSATEPTSPTSCQLARRIDPPVSAQI